MGSIPVTLAILFSPRPRLFFETLSSNKYAIHLKALNRLKWEIISKRRKRKIITRFFRPKTIKLNKKSRGSINRKWFYLSKLPPFHLRTRISNPKLKPFNFSNAPRGFFLDNKPLNSSLQIFFTNYTNLYGTRFKTKLFIDTPDSVYDLSPLFISGDLIENPQALYKNLSYPDLGSKNKNTRPSYLYHGFSNNTLRKNPLHRNNLLTPLKLSQQCLNNPFYRRLRAHGRHFYKNKTFKRSSHQFQKTLVFYKNFSNEYFYRGWSRLRRAKLTDFLKKSFFDRLFFEDLKRYKTQISRWYTIFQIKKQLKHFKRIRLEKGRGKLSPRLERRLDKVEFNVNTSQIRKFVVENKLKILNKKIRSMRLTKEVAADFSTNDNIQIFFNRSPFFNKAARISPDSYREGFGAKLHFPRIQDSPIRFLYAFPKANVSENPWGSDIDLIASGLGDDSFTSFLKGDFLRKVALPELTSFVKYPSPKRKLFKTSFNTSKSFWPSVTKDPLLIRFYSNWSSHVGTLLSSQKLLHLEAWLNPWILKSGAPNYLTIYPRGGQKTLPHYLYYLSTILQIDDMQFTQKEFVSVSWRKLFINSKYSFSKSFYSPNRRRLLGNRFTFCKTFSALDRLSIKPLLGKLKLKPKHGKFTPLESFLDFQRYIMFLKNLNRNPVRRPLFSTLFNHSLIFRTYIFRFSRHLANLSIKGTLKPNHSRFSWLLTYSGWANSFRGFNGDNLLELKHDNALSDFCRTYLRRYFSAGFLSLSKAAFDNSYPTSNLKNKSYTRALVSTSISSPQGPSFSGSLTYLNNNRSLITPLNFWNRGIILDYAPLYKYLLWDYSNSVNLDIPIYELSWFFLNRKVLNNLSFSERLFNFDKSNLIPFCTLKSNFKRKIVKLLANDVYVPRTTPYFYSTLVKFIEFHTGRRAFIKFNAVLENSIPFNDVCRCYMWYTRVQTFQRILGHRIFVNESIRIFMAALRFKDPFFLANWIRAMMYRISFWKYRVLFRYFKYLLRMLFQSYFKELNFKGIRITLRGKISVAGNARTRTLAFSVGKNSHAEMNNRVLSSFLNVHSFTGVMGFRLSFYF